MAGNSEHVVMSKTTKLAGATNYTVWKFHMRNVLQKEELWIIVSHDLALGAIIVVPTTLPAGADAAAAIAAQAKADCLLLKRQTKALAILCLSMKDKIIPHINELTDPTTV